MCGRILMSLSPPSPFSSIGTCSNFSRRSGKRLLDYRPLQPHLPATQAVNDLLLNGKRVCERFAWHKGESRSSSQNDNLLAPKDFDFPEIEWYSSEDDSSDETNVSTSSAPARFYHEPKSPRRGSLVRSISLVSNIMNELQREGPSHLPKERRKKAVVHKKLRPDKKAKLRLLTLTHPITNRGLIAGHHEEAHKFFL